MAVKTLIGERGGERAGLVMGVAKMNGRTDDNPLR
jgi:hypothetical protein